MQQYKYTAHRSKRNKKRTLNSIKHVFFGLALVILAGAIIYALFFCSLIRVKEIKISGVNVEIESQIRNKTKEFLGQKKIWFFPNDGIVLFDGDKLKSEIKKIGAVKDVFVKWKMPNSLEIRAEEREAAFNLCNSNGCFVIDDEGAVISDMLDGRLIVVNENCDDLEYCDKGKIQFIKETYELLDKTGIKMSSASLENCFTQKLSVKTDMGFKIYFNLTRPIKDQITVLRNILQKFSLLDKKEKLEYIDLQIEGKVYYK